MKEFLESKIMIAFVLCVLGLTLVSGVQTKKFEDANVSKDTKIVLK